MSKHSDLSSALLEATDQLPELEADHVTLLEDDGEPIVWDDELAVEAAEEPTAAADVSMPPERVCFCTPLLVQSEVGDRVAEGTVVNLSMRGLAAVAPIDVSAGDRLWASFRLELGEEPTTLCGEVVWRRSAGAGQMAFGLEFKGVRAEQLRCIEEAVRERAEGRALESPLPLVAAGQAARSRVRSPWLSAAAGMAAGIGLALVVSVIPRGELPAASLAPEAPAVAMAAPEQMPPIAPPDIMPQPQLPEPAAIAPPFVEPEAPAAASTAAEVSQPASETPEAPPRLEPSAPAEDLQHLRPTGAADSMSLALLADGPVAEHAAFWLSGPRRLVIDVPGRKSGFAKSIYAIEHPLASRLRVGEHGNRVRFVIETAAAVQADYEAKANGKALIVTLHAAPQLTLK